MKVSYGSSNVQLGKKLGEGAYGQVYRINGSNNVYKVLVPYDYNDDDTINYKIYDFMMIRESSIYHEINRAMHIVSVINLLIYSNKILYEMEYAGRTLNDSIHEKHISMKLIKQVLSSVSRCMIDVNNKFIINGDIKPQNIMILNGNVKLTDWSISRSNIYRGSINTFDELQTMWYRAPERIVRINHNNSKIDVWSLGVIFIEMLIQRCGVFPQNTEKDLMQNIIDVMGYDSLPKSYTDAFIKLNIGTFVNTKTCGKLDSILEQFIANPEYCDIVNLIKGMLQVNPNNRFDFIDVYNHTFLGNEKIYKPSIIERIDNLTFYPVDLSYIVKENDWYIEKRQDVILKIKTLSRVFKYDTNMISLVLRLMDMIVSNLKLRSTKNCDYVIVVAFNLVVVYNSSDRHECKKLYELISSEPYTDHTLHRLMETNKFICENMEFKFNINTGIYYDYVLLETFKNEPFIDKMIDDYASIFVTVQSLMSLIEYCDKSLARISIHIIKHKYKLVNSIIDNFLIDIADNELIVANKILKTE